MEKGIYFEKGYEAYFDGMSRDENPYDFDSNEYQEWLNGFDRADSDDDSDDLI